MQNPSQGINPELLPHLHCLSVYRFPTLQTVHQNKIAEWLISAPKIVRDSAPFYWSYLDRPGDGTIVLTWQPSEALGTNFASDGYIWSSVETVFAIPIEGYTLEVYQQKAGYVPGEPVATHARRRYRLLPAKFPNPNAPVPDPTLWITHYYQADPADRIPSNAIPPDIRTQSVMQTRAFLQSQGQIIQKEFMLHDRSKWPQIQFPGRGPPRGPAYYGGMGQARTPQAMAYPPHQAAGPASKRARTQANQPQGPPPGPPITDLVIDDEEDTSRGDMFDHMTPREVSQSRYMQNHEWMEEILCSPVPIDRIVPVDLGLGLSGELSRVTRGIFETYNTSKYLDKYENPDPSKDASHETDLEYIGRLDPDKADLFRKRATEYLAETNAEIEKLKAKHAKRMAKFKRGAIAIGGEKALRTAVHDTNDIGPEYWRLEGRVEDPEEGEERAAPENVGKVDDIVAQVEASLGRHTAAVKELRRIQDGGLQDSPAAPSVPASEHASEHDTRNGSGQSGVLVGDHDLDMGSAAGLLDQFHTGFSAATTPGNSFPTPQPLQGLSRPSSNVPSPAPQPHVEPAPKSESVKESVSRIANQEQAAGDDWVVIPPGGVSPPHAPAPPVSTPAPILPPVKPAILPPGYASVAAAPSQSAPQAQTQTQPPAQPPSHPPQKPTEDIEMSYEHDHDHDHDISPAEPVDFSDLHDLDTAGEALAGFESMGEMGGDMDMGMGGDMGMGMDDSAFGEAFEGVQRGAGEGGHGGESEGGM